MTGFRATDLPVYTLCLVISAWVVVNLIKEDFIEEDAASWTMFLKEPSGVFFNDAPRHHGIVKYPYL